ncbi:MAG TPA: hypothetical protein VFI91_04635 [Longimicrobiaceae bacterium]|nr:hypothetical protein [Longimicrobiaceae bacterium]
MALSARFSDSKREALERNSFIVLQHLNVVTGGDPESLAHLWRIADALGLPRPEIEEISAHLHERRFCVCSDTGPLISITDEGVNYLEHGAWRRRSVRT